MKVSFIGLGNMGSGMAARILKANFELTVFNRSRSKMEPLLEAGAKGGASVADTVRDADVVVTSLMDDKSALDMVASGMLEAMKPGAIHLGTTTISPQCADELARIHKEAGTVYVAGPVIGRPDAAAAGELITYLAGEEQACKAVMPICRAYARMAERVSDRHSVANSLKLCVNYTAVSLIELMGEVYAFAERSGVPTEEVNNFFQHAFAAPVLKMYATKIRTRDFDGAMGFAMTAGLKDVTLMQEAHERVGVPFEIGSIIRDNNPVFFLWHINLMMLKGHVPQEDYVIPLGVADVKREGSDVTVLASGQQVHFSLKAAEALAKDGISVEVVDARSFEPFDTDTLLRSVEKTSRLVVVDEDYERGGFAAEVCAQMMEKGYDLLDAPVKRVCHPHMPIPGGYIDAYTMPTLERIESAIRDVCR